MIRINLLPQKRDARGASDVNLAWLKWLAGVLLAEAIVLLVVHQMKREELAEKVRENGELQMQIEQGKQRITSHAQVKADLAALRAREEAIGRLLSARTGPTAVLLELAHVLTPGRGPTVDPAFLGQLRQENPAAQFNLGWDTKRLWVDAYRDTDRVVRIVGQARDANDVSELARRLSLSAYFGDVKLLPASRTSDANAKIDLIHFELQAKAKY